MKVTVKSTYRNLRIFIDGILHLSVRLENHDGLQSWFEGDKKRNYFIELYRKEGEPILLEYVNKELWQKMLQTLDDNL